MLAKVTKQLTGSEAAQLAGDANWQIPTKQSDLKPPLPEI